MKFLTAPVLASSTARALQPHRLFLRIAIVLLALSAVATCSASTAANIETPALGSTLSATRVTFTWTKGVGISAYKLAVGTANGTWNIFNASEGTRTSQTVGNIPTGGGTVWVKLSSRSTSSGNWSSQIYSYATAPGASQVALSLSPMSVALAPSGTQSFTATITGSSNSSVSWSASSGTISGSGMTVTYTAPAIAGTYTVTAKSMADTSKSASATVTVATAPVQVSIGITPQIASLNTSASQNFTASVSGTTNTTVTWSTTGGTISGTGSTVTYTAPVIAGTYMVTAVSGADTSKSATATITVTAPVAQNPCSSMSLGVGAGLGGFRPFAANNAWNEDISAAPIDSNSGAIISYIGASVGLHADFGSGTYGGAPIGIPYVVVDSTQPNVNVSISSYPADSDISPMPIPSNAPIEGYPNPGDNHVIVLDKSNCFEFELYAASLNASTWSAGSSALWDLQGNEMRPYTWTSADAAGLPIFPGLVRYDELAAGAISHAIRFTLPKTEAAFVPPASHWAATDSGSPIPMGMRIRLKANFDVSGYSAANQVILNGMKKYGLILADNGSSMYISGTPDNRWNNDDLHVLGQITASNFEVVQMNPIYTSSNVPTGAAPSIGSITASAYTVAAGTPVTLNWNVANVSYVFISPTIGPVRGSSVTFAPTQTATYTLTATNQYGRNTATVTVSVQ